ncbi:hypothetical protein LCGC14_1294210 [marine sediment metagenome]|uniref:Uncharacterized protein n=1 Tax=marine sediment metagenome TaxID=412755 RepID=A0A0F9NUH0_9ZZZZ
MRTLVDKIYRGTRKRFEVYITDLGGSAQDPDTCEVTLIKEGEYSYDSPKGPYACSKVGNVGYWGADVDLSASMTLGNWTANFDWVAGGVEDDAFFGFIVEDKVRPFINRRASQIPPNVEVVG